MTSLRTRPLRLALVNDDEIIVDTQAAILAQQYGVAPPASRLDRTWAGPGEPGSM